MVRILCRHAVEKNSFLIAMVQSRILTVSIFYLDTNLSNLEIRRIWYGWSSTVGINPTLSDPFTPRNSKLGPLKPIKLIGINSRDALIDKKTQEQKWLKIWTILKNLKEKKSDFSPLLNPDTSWWLARCPRPLNHRFGC